MTQRGVPAEALDAAGATPARLMEVVSAALEAAGLPVVKVERDGDERSYVIDYRGQIVLLRASWVARRHSLPGEDNALRRALTSFRGGVDDDSER